MSLGATIAPYTHAQEGDDLAALAASLKAQQALNQRLLERIEALESSQTEILQKLGAAERQAGGQAFPRECDEGLEELRDDFFDFQDRLDQMPTLSGYYDFEYFNDNRDDSPGEFRQHHLSLHLTKEWDQWRLFSEFEFEFGAKFEGDGADDLEEARGEVKVEQVWSEYVHSDALTLRGGLILTPGYWNVNHYPIVVLPTRRPLMVRKVFRESFVGLMAYGSRYGEKHGITYTGYVGNGRSVYFTKHDDNEGKAIGGKLTWHVPTNDTVDTLNLGLSAYHESPSGEDRVFTWGVDAQLRTGPWELLTELAKRDATEDRTGFYLQPSYRWDEQWAAFYRYDLMNIEHEGETQEHTLGVNYRPIPDVSLKLEYFHSARSEGEDADGVAASIAIAF